MKMKDLAKKKFRASILTMMNRTAIYKLRRKTLRDEFDNVRSWIRSR